MAGVSILIPGVVFYGASLHGDPAKPVLVIICKGLKSKQSQLHGPFGLCHNSCPCSGRMNSAKTTGSLGSRVFHYYHQPSWLGWKTLVLIPRTTDIGTVVLACKEAEAKD